MSTTIVISHGSAGLSTTELNIAQFFLAHGYPVQIFDHFHSRNIPRLNWSLQEDSLDQLEISILDLYEDFDSLPEGPKIHIGVSLGGYLGIANSHLFDKVFSYYPGFLPFPDHLFKSKKENIHIFKAELDSWCEIPEECNHFFPRGSINLIEKAQHGFMSLNKDLRFEGIKYKFKNYIVTPDELRNYKFNHSILKKFSTFESLDIRVQSNDQARNYTLNKILQIISRRTFGATP